MMLNLHTNCYQYIKCLLSCLALCYLCACSDVQTVTAKDTAGQNHVLTGQDVPIVLVYWAEWCATCRTEVEVLNDLNKSGEVAVYGVYYDPKASIETITANLAGMGMLYPVLAEQPDHALGLPEVSVIPAHFIIKTDGKVIGPLLGPQSSGTIIQLSKD